MRRGVSLVWIPLVAALPSVASAQWTESDLEPPADPAPPPEPAGMDPEMAAQFRQVEELWAEEPSWPDTTRAAMRWIQVHPEAIEQVRARLRSKAGAPLLIYSGWYEHAEGRRDLTLSPGPLRDLDDVVSTDHPRTTALMAFNLPDAVFTPSELQTYSLTIIQQQILRMVNFWYYYRRHFAVMLYIDPPRDPRARTTLELRVRGFTALLDFATGGWFSRQLPEGSI